MARSLYVHVKSVYYYIYCVCVCVLTVERHSLCESVYTVYWSHYYKKYGTEARGIIILAFSSLSRKYLTLLFIASSKLSILATLPHR